MKIHFIDGLAVRDQDWFVLLDDVARDEETDRLLRKAFEALAEVIGLPPVKDDA